MNSSVVKRCFPSQLEADVEVVLNTLCLESKHEPYMPFEVRLDNEKLVIPQRIYCDQSQLNNLLKLTPIQQAIGYCFYSRHFDGFVRERCVKMMFSIDEKFVIPFIIHLVGEYVIEILEQIYISRESIDKANLKSFLVQNREYYNTISQRVYSYWDCFYRTSYPKYRRNVQPLGKTNLDYPGIKLLRFFREDVVYARN